MGGLVKVDIGHGRGWLAPEPAASLARIDAQLGRLADINEAGRSPERADENHRKWLAYKNGTGPWAPYALPADESVHCWGYASDSDDWYNAAAAAVWRENGWRQTARYDDDRDEPWHGEYSKDNDKNYGKEIDMPLNDADKKWLRETIGWERKSAVNGLGFGDMLRVTFDSIRYGKKGVRTHGEGMNDLLTRLGAMQIQIDGQTAAIEALAKAQGADPAAILKAVTDGVNKAMDKLEVTLSVDAS